MIVSAKKANLKKKVILDEIPFDSSRKLMSVLIKNEMQTKGAPNILINK